MILFYDTETTGKYNFNLKPDHPSQPHLVQYAGLLVDPDTQRLVMAFVSIVDPGVPIPKEATAIHGISTEMAQRARMKPYRALDWHMDALEQATLTVAHNIDFDKRILDTVAVRMNGRILPSSLDIPEFCTMKKGTDLCKLPGPYGFKWPKLEELHHHLFHESFQAHDALADVQACARCYFAMTGSKPKEPDRVTVDVSAVPARCPLCNAEPVQLEPMRYRCGCIVDLNGKVQVPCQAGVPRA